MQRFEAPAPSPLAAGPARRLRLHVLGSGSKGNCALVESGEGLIMIDNGFSRRETLARMHALGLDEGRVRALIITHEHTDHTGGIPVWFRSFPCPLYASEGTAEARGKLSELPVHPFAAGDEIEIGDMCIETFPTSHDVVNPIGMRITCGDDTVGYVTDTGSLSARAMDALANTRILALESNHDIPMLRTGDYPRHLQDRIASDFGHLSNAQAAEAAVKLVGERTEHVVAMHISQENNRPSLAVRALAASLGAQLDNELGSSATLTRAGGAAKLRIRAAGQNRPITVG